MSDYNLARKTVFTLRILRFYHGTDRWFDIYNGDKHAVDLADEAVAAFDIGIQYVTDDVLRDRIQKIRDRMATVKGHPTPFEEYKAVFREIRALSREDERLVLTK